MTYIYIISQNLFGCNFFLEICIEIQNETAV